ncbi:MAG: DUF2333 family protein [Pseudomonadota bacterium]
MDSWQNRLALRWDDVRERWGLRNFLSPLLVLLFLLLLALLALGWYWGRETAPFPVQAEAGPAGIALASVQGRMAQALLDKPGGYLNNDLLPPGSLADDIPAWERGVLHEMRDLSRSMQPLSLDSPLAPDLAEAAEAFAVAPDAWGMPSVEGEMARGREALARHRERLRGPGGAELALREAQLRRWLAGLQARLDDLAMRLNAAQAASLAPGVTVAPGTEAVPATSWARVDDVFFEARGSAWAQLHLLKAAELDFAGLLQARHADLAFRAAIHELEATRQPLWSPVILNGAGFGLFANHSLVLANYLQRTRAELAEVQALLAAP